MSDLIDHICATLEMEGEKAAQTELQYWQSVRDAHKNGKKLVLFAGPVPVELLYAADCVPLYADLLPQAISKNSQLLRGYIRDVETHVSENLCSASKSILGALRQGGLEIDAFIRAPIFCPSFKSAYDEAQTYLAVPHFEFDTPTRLTERNLDYLTAGLDRAMDFLESVTGKRPELSEIRALMEQSEQSKALLDECAAARKASPCPMSLHMTSLGRLMPVLRPERTMRELLVSELALCTQRREGAREEHRVFFLQCPQWCARELRDFLEEKYGAFTVMDGLGYEEGPLFGDIRTDRDCLRELAGSLFSPPLLHGGTLAAPILLERCIKTVREYSPDVLLFLGDRWCRQTWSVTKMLSDEMQDKFGLSMLMTDADGIDSAYKDEKQLKTLISEYMDTVICGK